MSASNSSLGREQYLGLTALSMAVFLVANDFTAFAPALPAIENEFNVDITTSQWIINGYALVFGVLIITGGRLADLYGRRNIFFCGTLVFMFFSLLGGLAVNVYMLLISRALMGIGAAMMWPSVLGMTYNLMPEDRSGQAGGLIMAVCAFANAIGPVLGGTLADLLSWRWIFLINIPIASLAMFVCWKVVPFEPPEQTDEKIDYPGVATLSISLFGLLFALDMSGQIGFKHPLIIALLTVFCVFICVFAITEYRTGRNALVPGDVIGNRKFLAASVVTLLVAVLYFSALLYVPQFLTKTQGYSAMQSGMSLIPLMVISGVFAYLSGRFYEVIGPRWLAGAGVLCMCVGMFMLSHLNDHTGFVALLPGMAMLGTGIGLFNPAITTAAITAVSPSRASLAGAVLYMFKIAGGAIGLGMNATIVAFAPDIASGIDRAFTVNAYLALAGLIGCLFFVGASQKKEVSG
ncbi:MFS transporter [Microbulbifer sp. THAF38]|uniref:MFS transporter n=1 Tax=Microbulbifer sp. THAF38 TaxID=2587856 RepID=UPI00126875EC|nr:MFS transporter [Microbulbifer sp. THAF38]QFT54496.1 Multidrug resistance protein 3 [Microbulbifer sp. THAF38]